MRLDAPVNLYLPEQLQVKDQGYIRQVLLRDLHPAGPIARPVDQHPARHAGINDGGTMRAPVGQT